MESVENIHCRLISAVASGDVETVKRLIDLYGLSYSPNWADGLVLLHKALETGHTEIAKLLLTRGARVNSKNRNPVNYTPLHLAINTGDVDLVKMILLKGVHVDDENKDGLTPLQAAIKKGVIEIIALLLDNGANVNFAPNVHMPRCSLVSKLHYLDCASNYGKTPLEYAVNSGKKDIVKLLLMHNAIIQPNVLHIAALRGYVQIAEDLLNHGANIHSKLSILGKKEYTPLHFATEKGCKKTVGLFLDNGADVNATTENGMTSLHIAFKKGHKEILKLLFEHGAKVDAHDKDGNTILDLAVENQNLNDVKDILQFSPDIRSNKNCLITAVSKKDKKIVEALLQYGFTFNPEDVNNSLLRAAIENEHLKVIENLSPDIKSYSSHLITAVSQKDKKIVETLLQYGFTFNPEDINNSSLLHAAVENGHVEVVENLLKSGADVDIPRLPKTSNSEKFDPNPVRSLFIEGYTLLHNAVQNKQENIVRLLLNYGANINCNTNDKETPLHIAAKLGFIDIAKILLEFGVDIDYRNSYGKTALHIACEKRYINIILVLIEYGFDINSECANTCTPYEYAKKAYYTSNSPDYSNCNHNCYDYRYVSYPDYYEDYDIDDVYYGDYDIDDVYYGDYQYERRDDRSNNIDQHDIDYDKDIEVLTKYIIQLKTAGLYVSNKNLLASQNVVSPSYENDCEKELRIIKSKIIDNTNISYYDILTKDMNQLQSYARNESVVQALNSDYCKTKFLIYGNMIRNRFKIGYRRKQLLDLGNDVFNSLFKNVCVLPDYCTEQILSQLTDEELRIFIDTHFYKLQYVCDLLNT